MGYRRVIAPLCLFEKQRQLGVQHAGKMLSLRARRVLCGAGLQAGYGR